MISRSEIKCIASVGHQKLIDLAPLRVSVFVPSALDGVTHADHERRVFGRNLFPNLLVDARLSFSGPVAQNGEAEQIFRCGSLTPQQNR